MFYCLTMPESNLSLTEQRELFAFRGRTNPMAANREIGEYCQRKFGEVLINPYVYTSIQLNQHGQDWDINKGIIVSLRK